MKFDEWYANLAPWVDNEDLAKAAWNAALSAAAQKCIDISHRDGITSDSNYFHCATEIMAMAGGGELHVPTVRTAE